MQIQIIQLMAACRDGGHDCIVDTGFPKLIRQHTFPLFEKKAVSVQYIPADILLYGQPVVKLIPQSGKTSQNGIGLHTLFNAEVGKSLHNVLKRHLPYLQKTCQFISRVSDACNHTVLNPANR